MEHFEIIELGELNPEDAMQLLIYELENEAKMNSEIVLSENLEEERKQLTDLWNNALHHMIGKAVLQDGKLAGFLAFYGPINNFFGNCDGAFSPLGCSAFGTQNRELIAAVLLQNCMEELLKNQITHIAISRYAGDNEIGRLLNLNSFGMRCSDAMMVLENYELEPQNCRVSDSKELSFVFLEGQQRMKMKELDQALTAHLLSSPCCFITNETDFHSLVSDSEKEVIAAYVKDEIVGYMILTHGGETFLAERESVRSICGCYVKPEFRHAGIAKALLDEVVKHVKNQGYLYLGTDYETINPTALRFWTKYFSPYTYSYIRRLDERLIG